MTATHDIDADADRPDDEGGLPAAATVPAAAGEPVTGPLTAQRTDVRRRLMALRRW